MTRTRRALRWLAPPRRPYRPTRIGAIAASVWAGVAALATLLTGAAPAVAIGAAWVVSTVTLALEPRPAPRPRRTLMHVPRPDHATRPNPPEPQQPDAGDGGPDELHDSCPDCPGTPATGTCTCPPLWVGPEWAWV